MPDLRYDFSKAKAATERVGFVWIDAAVPAFDARLAAIEPALTQGQVDQLLDLYADALTFFTTGTLPGAGDPPPPAAGEPV